METKKLLFILCVLAIVSCGGKKNMPLTRLNDIASYLDDRPDSALAELKSIDTLTLKSKASKAKYSVLLAAALDKNDFITTDTRIVEPAVDYYDRHGSPEDRLKAYMYLGTAQFNNEDYSNAIVSYYKAIESVPEVDNQKLVGILYSRIAMSYTETMDFVQAADYYDKSIECFKAIGNKNFEYWSQVCKSVCLLSLKNWEKADSLFQQLLKDTSVSPLMRTHIEINYAGSLLIRPVSDEAKALQYFTSAIKAGGKITNSEFLYAYAFALFSGGKDAEAEKVLQQIKKEGRYNYYSDTYWRHRKALHEKDYATAYRAFWAATQSHDSVLTTTYAKSAANAQRIFFEQKDIASRLKINNQRKFIIIVVLALLSSILATALLYTRKKKSELEERDKMNLLVDSLNRQIQEMKNEKKTAKFALMADVYEEVYRFSNTEESSKDQLFDSLKTRFGDLRSDNKAQSGFEKLLDRDLDGIMGHFRQDYPNLSEDEFKLASYYFAGFDNTTVMMILGLPNLETTRKRKSRLKKKILDSAVLNKEKYLSSFEKHS
jgi:tetratricopeptide (TPR) repeat protein